MLPYRVLELRYYLTAGGESPFESWFSDLDAAALLRDEGCGMGTSRRCSAFDQTKHLRLGSSFTFSRFCSHMDNLSGYANRPFPFVLRYLRRRLASHVVIFSSVVAAVA